MGLKGETLVEDGTEVGKFGDLGDDEGGRNRGERGRVHRCVTRAQHLVGDSWKTTILDLREENVNQLRSQEVWEEWIRPCMEEGVWVMRQKSST